MVRSLEFLSTLAVPAAPTLAAPANATAGEPTALTLTWNSAARATAYDAQVSLVSTFATTILDEPGLSGPRQQRQDCPSGLSISGMSMQAIPAVPRLVGCSEFHRRSSGACSEFALRQRHRHGDPARAFVGTCHRSYILFDPDIDRIGLYDARCQSGRPDLKFIRSRYLQRNHVLCGERQEWIGNQRMDNGMELRDSRSSAWTPVSLLRPTAQPDLQRL